MVRPKLLRNLVHELAELAVMPRYNLTQDEYFRLLDAFGALDFREYFVGDG